jgi:hypothetical protein
MYTSRSACTGVLDKAYRLCSFGLSDVNKAHAAMIWVVTLVVITGMIINTIIIIILINTIFHGASRDSVVGLATGYRLDDRGVRVRVR